jgi:hypothetical protein
MLHHRLAASSGNLDLFRTSTTMLLHGEGTNNSTTITDSSPTAATITANGNAKISTTQFKYGSASLAFDGSGDYLTTNGASANYTFGTGDFTVEMFAYSTALSNAFNLIYDSRPSGTNGLYPTIFVLAAGNLQYQTNSGVQIDGGAIFTTSTWHHIAVCRFGTSTRLFFNGSQVGSTYSDSNNYLNGSGRPVIGISGVNVAGASGWNGYIDELRVTKTARYTTNFTPPLSALPDVGY